MAGFSATVDAWVRETRERQTAVLRESAERLTEEIQKVGPSVANPSGGEGGRMPVATGYLRASLQASLDGSMPPLRDNPGQASVAYNPGPISAVIADAKVGDRITFAYGANYARLMENRYGFVRLAAQRWPQIVAEVAREAKQGAGA